VLDEVSRKTFAFKGSCKTLLKIATEIDRFVRKKGLQDKRIKPYLERELLHYQQKIQRTKSFLRDGMSPLIVTGEVSTGKSSFLNVLCEGDKSIFPISATSCICEVKYGEEGKAIVHQANPNDQKEGLFEVEIGDLDKYVSSEKTSCKKVEIYFPSELLKAGVVFVDTPGVGADNLSVMESVESYLQDSVGFVYVVNDAVNIHRVGCMFVVDLAEGAGIKPPKKDCLKKSRQSKHFLGYHNCYMSFLLDQHRQAHAWFFTGLVKLLSQINKNQLILLMISHNSK
jgi:hypothetical protein